MSAETNHDLQYLLDKDAIRDLIYSYSYHADLNHPNEVAELFTEDCVVDYGPGAGGRIEGLARMKAFQNKVLSEGVEGSSSSKGMQFVNTSHHNANSLIRFVGPDRAEGITSCYAWHKLSGDAPNAKVWGYYYDVFIRTQGGWKFAERVLKFAGDENYPLEYIPLDRAND